MSSTLQSGARAPDIAIEALEIAEMTENETDHRLPIKTRSGTLLYRLGTFINGRLIGFSLMTSRKQWGFAAHMVSIAKPFSPRLGILGKGLYELISFPKDLHVGTRDRLAIRQSRYCFIYSDSSLHPLKLVACPHRYPLIIHRIQLSVVQQRVPLRSSLRMFGIVRRPVEE